jgi:NosR/NirI family nitrous oxide reductase transcriptional regulator
VTRARAFTWVDPFRGMLLPAVALSLLVGPAGAQDVGSVRPSLLEEVMPTADRFDRPDGDPPVRRAYAGDELIGYVFLTSDVPPEVDGYSGPIRVLVGLSLDGTITGVRVTDYRESRRYDWGDFLSDPWLLDQFTGKHLTDRFRLNQDLDGISQVTISVRAMTRGIRDAARRVALAYAPGEQGAVEYVSDADLRTMSWYEMRARGLATTLVVDQPGRTRFSVSLMHVSSDSLGTYMIGRMYESVLAAVERRGGADHVVLYVLEGTGFQAPLRDGWSIEQGGKTFAVPREDVVTTGTPGGGVLLEESSQVGALLLDDENVRLDEPLTFAFDRGRPDLGTFRAEYTSREASLRVVAAASPAEIVDSATPPAPVDRAPIDTAPSITVQPTPSTPQAEALPPRPDPMVLVERAVPLPSDEEESLLSSSSWLRTGSVVLVLLLATAAFLTKNATLRWVSLSTTLIVLGWVDGGFLSISHLTSLIWVGPSAIMSDLPLVIMIGFTLVALVIWGRVFCGYLCPFGALQDFIDRLVPRRFKRELPKDVHRTLLKAKYLILAIVLLPAIAGSQVSLYQYFEPFGTVFFLGRNALLWGIAGSILVTAAIVPRFYCRYACPLGASLALGSLLTVRRIPRVEQCDHCKVCEQHCPTGAIEGPALDFKECVRCNECENRLAHRSGVCRHEMDAIRPRLIQMQARAGRAAGVAAEPRV